MKALVHPGEFVYVYEEGGIRSPLMPFLIIIQAVYPAAIIVPEPDSYNGLARIVVRLSSDEKVVYFYEYTDKHYKTVSRYIAKLENKDRTPIKSSSFIQIE